MRAILLGLCLLAGLGCGGGSIIDLALPRTRAKNEAPTTGTVDFYLISNATTSPSDLILYSPTASGLAVNALSSFTIVLEGQYEFVFTATGTKDAVAREFRNLPFETSTTARLLNSGDMDAMHQTRERALASTRLLIQTSSKCIRHVHRQQFEEARRLLDEAKSISAKAREDLRPHPALFYAGYLQDAEKEMVEAAAVLAMVQGDPFPTPEGLGVGLASYLNGMGEAASEARRYVLDAMRGGRLPVAEGLLAKMETIYDDLITFDYPDSLTGGLRRTCDALRAVIERTRSDLTLTLSQQELLTALREANQG